MLGVCDENLPVYSTVLRCVILHLRLADACVALVLFTRCLMIQPKLSPTTIRQFGSTCDDEQEEEAI